MDPSEMRYLEDDDTPTMKTIKGATTGLVTGTIWGTIVATWYDVPRVERSVALPGLVRTLRLMGNYGATFAAIGGVYIGVEQLVHHYRGKRDFINGAVGGLAAGATVLGYRGKSISTALSAGAALAFTSSVLDAGGQTMRIDTGTFDSVGSMELQNAGKACLVTVQGKISAVLGTVLVCALLFITVFPDQAEQIIAIFPGS